MTFTHHEHTPSPEHPFAEFVRILGKGKKGSRPLTQSEAYQAMKMILMDDVLPIQLGAFLMLMRVKEETPEEIAGFVSAAKESFQLIEHVPVDLDWSTYAGKRRHLPWFLLSALLLVENGIKVFMHGAQGHTPNRIYTHNVLHHLGLSVANSITQAQQQLADQGFSYLSLAHFCPKLHDIIELRPVLGLRSPVHTLVRLLNPFNAPYSIQGIFHPSYRAVHQQAAGLLNQLHMAVLKGEGGETERNPDVACLVQSVHQGEFEDETWEPIFLKRHLKSENLDPQQLGLLWQGKQNDEFGEASVIGTAAVALKLLGKVSTKEDAHALATQYWYARNRHRFG
jgi:anthranilate phosphoribosyltransferase